MHHFFLLGENPKLKLDKSSVQIDLFSFSPEQLPNLVIECDPSSVVLNDVFRWEFSDPTQVSSDHLLSALSFPIRVSEQLCEYAIQDPVFLTLPSSSQRFDRPVVYYLEFPNDS